MPIRHIPALVSAIWLSIASGYAHAESQAEYAEKAHASWQQQNKLMEESYSRLLSEAEAEPNKEPAQQLKQAKEQWEEFRNSFCKSVSQTYGGQWQSVRESECRVNLANQGN
jgi:ABC-type cobalamin transport system ATPase subunit